MQYILCILTTQKITCYFIGMSKKNFSIFYDVYHFLFQLDSTSLSYHSRSFSTSLSYLVQHIIGPFASSSAALLLQLVQFPSFPGPQLVYKNMDVQPVCICMPLSYYNESGPLSVRLVVAPSCAWATGSTLSLPYYYHRCHYLDATLIVENIIINKEKM
ncbi:unnamed protein product [Heterosigma akashiwo]